MPNLINIRIINHEDWDFKGANTQYLTHSLHPYPARMIPQIVRKLLKRYASEGDVVLDPFCGSGTVLVEARLLGMHSIGIDICPLACLIAKVKSTPLNPRHLKDYWLKLKYNISRDIIDLRFGKLKNVDIPEFTGTNIEYWFKPITIKELAIIRKHLKDIKDKDVRNFFEISFSHTVREVSGVRKGEFKLYRIPKEKWEKYIPDTLGIFIKHVKESIQKMAKFYEACFKDVFSKVFLADTRKMFTDDFPKEANNLLKENPPKIIVTSPPYGDSKTTVAYGQFSRLSSLWLDFEENFHRNTVMKVDEMSLGGNIKSAVYSILKKDFISLRQTIDLIMERDKKRALQVIAFFADLYKCLINMYNALEDDGYCCIVIANRTVRRVQIPTHVIIAEMGVDVGFKNNITIIPRNIPTKRLPWKNAPENIPGLKGKTMSKENIIIMKK